MPEGDRERRHANAGDLALAAVVRAACVEAAERAYEAAGVQGLCAEGRWELALDAMKHLDLRGLVSGRAEGQVTPGDE